MSYTLQSVHSRICSRQERYSRVRAYKYQGPPPSASSASSTTAFPALLPEHLSGRRDVHVAILRLGMKPLDLLFDRLSRTAESAFRVEG